MINLETPLTQLNAIRGDILADVMTHSKRAFDLPSEQLSELLADALYQEKGRLKTERPNVFTRGRIRGDKKLFQNISSKLARPDFEAPRAEILERWIDHYSEEIAGEFTPNVYRFATRAVPFGFNFLLNAASVQNFMPWRFTEDVSQRIALGGHTEQLQKLAKIGTILLVPTHQSNIDSVLIGFIIYLLHLPPFAYGAGINLYSNPILKYFMSNLGAYTVDRKKNNPLYKNVVKNYSTALLTRGIHSVFFPGGGRSRSGAIESKIKLGLLGTALESQITHVMQGDFSRKIFVVPMSMSYHFVLEASSLIENYLEESGKHRFLKNWDESDSLFTVGKFFWKLFSTRSGMTIRIGQPLDVLGNAVDFSGQSLSQNGQTLDLKRFFSSYGEYNFNHSRDTAYTENLGQKVVEQYYKQNAVLSSHAVAFAFFETLRKRYRDYDLYRFLRLLPSQRALQREVFMTAFDQLVEALTQKAARQELALGEEFSQLKGAELLAHGLKNLGIYHNLSPVKEENGDFISEDLMLLYYYRNRLSGYESAATRGKHDDHGFLV